MTNVNYAYYLIVSFVYFFTNAGIWIWYLQIELLSMVHHKYLVSLIGYCLAPNNYMLVYEYMSGGDLRNRLHGNYNFKIVNLEAHVIRVDGNFRGRTVAGYINARLLSTILILLLSHHYVNFT
jgi:serine/threonine protein kinase